MIKQKIAIIVAGGKGERMNSDIPKQFLDIQGKTILMHTLEAFYKFDATIQLILVLPEVHIDFWKKLCQKFKEKTFWNITTPYLILTTL